MEGRAWRSARNRQEGFGKVRWCELFKHSSSSKKLDSIKELAQRRQHADVTQQLCHVLGWPTWRTIASQINSVQAPRRASAGATRSNPSAIAWATTHLRYCYLSDVTSLRHWRKWETWGRNLRVTSGTSCDAWSSGSCRPFHPIRAAILVHVWCRCEACHDLHRLQLLLRCSSVIRAD